MDVPRALTVAAAVLFTAGCSGGNPATAAARAMRSIERLMPMTQAGP